MAFVAGVGASGMLTAALTSRGLHQLGGHHRPTCWLLNAGAVAGGLLGAVFVQAAHLTKAWQLFPAYVVWGCVLVAAGLCDAATQRIPTLLARAGAVTVTFLFAVGFATRHDWIGLALTAIAALASAAIMLVCWRLLGVGLGDVRLALLGGLGLGGADQTGLLVGLTVCAVTVGCRVVTQRTISGSWQGHIPLGPALAAGFISAVVLSAVR